MNLGASLNLPSSLTLAQESALLATAASWPVMPIRIGYYPWAVFGSPTSPGDFTRIDRVTVPLLKAGHSVIYDFVPCPQPTQTAWLALNGGASWDWFETPDLLLASVAAQTQLAIKRAAQTCDAIGVPRSRIGWAIGGEASGGGACAPAKAAPGQFLASKHRMLDSLADLDWMGTSPRGPSLCWFGTPYQEVELSSALAKRTWSNVFPVNVNLRVSGPKAPFRDANGNPSTWYSWCLQWARYVSARLGSKLFVTESYCTLPDFNGLATDKPDALAAMVSAFRDSGAVDTCLPFTPGFPTKSVQADGSDDFDLTHAFSAALAAMKMSRAV